MRVQEQRYSFPSVIRPRCSVSIAMPTPHTVHGGEAQMVAEFAKQRLRPQDAIDVRFATSPTTYKWSVASDQRVHVDIGYHAILRLGSSSLAPNELVHEYLGHPRRLEEHRSHFIRTRRESDIYRWRRDRRPGHCRIK